MIRQLVAAFFRRRPLVPLMLLGAIPSACGQAILSAPIGSTIAISVNPPFIAANGDTAVVSVLVIEPAGTPVPDGTVVQFFTTLGVIQEQAKTNDGVARVNLISDTRSGTATVTVFSGSVTTSADVTIGATRPARVVPALIDPRIDLSAGRTIGGFKVTVLDANGNGVSGVLVRFSVIENPALDTILHGTDHFTDNSGDAFGEVQTKRITSGTIRLRADVLTGTSLSVEFTIQVTQ
ncbi:MAG: hypothetical protein JJE39_05715 [Vicinamibacteria bacterium]|nr:hypothetical protein [Vicinamibacteria bacterium]